MLVRPAPITAIPAVKPLPAYHNVTIRRGCSLLAPRAVASTTRATAAAPVHPISGPPAPLDPETGYVSREAHPAHVPGEFGGLLSSIVTAYHAACGDRLVGVYLRGSLPRGLFIPGISDVDTFALLLPAAAPDMTPNTSCQAQHSIIIIISSSRTLSSSAGITSLHDLQQAVKGLSSEAIQAHQHLGFTKLELKLLEVSAGSPAAAVLSDILTNTLQAPPTGKHNSSSDSSSSSSSGDDSDLCSSTHTRGVVGAQLLRPSMCPSIPLAFELKTASLCLSGVDLPQLLPPCAALPPQYEGLTTLTDSVTDARAAVQQAADTLEAAAAAAACGPSGVTVSASGSTVCPSSVMVAVEVQVRATKWALKRLMRAAFELVQDRAGYYTRDLYWCCAAAKQHLPQLQHELTWHAAGQQQQDWQQQLDRALQLYVDLQATLLHMQQHSTQQEGQQLGSAAAAAATAQQQLQQLVPCSWQLVDVLLPKLEALFLKLMLVEEQGWLTQHQGQAIPAGPTTHSSNTSIGHSTAFSSSNSTAGSSDEQPDGLEAAAANSQLRTDTASQQLRQQQQQEGTQQTPWLFAGRALQALQGLLSPQAAAAAAAGPGPITQLVGSAPPAVTVPVLGQVAAWDWCDEQQRAAAASAVRLMLLQGRPGTCGRRGVALLSSAADPAAESELLDSWPQPVVLRGAAASWPCVTQPWSLHWLQQQQELVGKVRVAPSLQFPFVEPHLLGVLLTLRGRQAAPSLLVDMSAAEFVQRLQPGNRLPHIAYKHSENYYLQADLPQHLQHGPELDGLLRSFAEASDNLQQVGITLTQQPRLWVSPAGAVSPLHYDKSHSFLVQVLGVKRMLFFSPDQLYRLSCYPDTHMLRRRSRLNMAAPNLAKHPLFRQAAALQVDLHPGDVLCFPPFWSHHTESLGQGVLSPNGNEHLIDAAGCSMSITFRCQASGGARV